MRTIRSAILLATLEEKLGPSFDACKDHEGMKKAMENLPLD